MPKRDTNEFYNKLGMMKFSDSEYAKWLLVIYLIHDKWPVKH